MQPIWCKGEHPLWRSSVVVNTRKPIMSGYDHPNTFDLLWAVIERIISFWGLMVGLFSQCGLKSPKPRKVIPSNGQASAINNPNRTKSICSQGSHGQQPDPCYQQLVTTQHYRAWHQMVEGREQQQVATPYTPLGGRGVVDTLNSANQHIGGWD